MKIIAHQKKALLTDKPFLLRVKPAPPSTPPSTLKSGENEHWSQYFKGTWNISGGSKMSQANPFFLSLEPDAVTISLIFQIMKSG